MYTDCSYCINNSAVMFTVIKFFLLLFKHIYLIPYHIFVASINGCIYVSRYVFMYAESLPLTIIVHKFSQLLSNSRVKYGYSVCMF